MLLHSSFLCWSLKEGSSRFWLHIVGFSPQQADITVKLFDFHFVYLTFHRRWNRSFIRNESFIRFSVTHLNEHRTKLDRSKECDSIFLLLRSCSSMWHCENNFQRSWYDALCLRDSLRMLSNTLLVTTIKKDVTCMPSHALPLTTISVSLNKCIPNKKKNILYFGIHSMFKNYKSSNLEALCFNKRSIHLIPWGQIASGQRQRVSELWERDWRT